MASTTTAPSTASTSADDSFSPFDWIQLHSKALTVVLVGGLVVGAGYALWKRSIAIKEERAEQAYFQALRTTQSGNPQLAEADMEKLITRYAGTAAATQAAMNLAILQFESGNYAKGLSVLEKVKASGVPKTFEASVEGLIAAGLVDSGKPADGAARYRVAADKAPFPAEHDTYLAEAARALLVAGRKEEALAIWKELGANEDSPAYAEAHVRIGELTAAQ